MGFKGSGNKPKSAKAASFGSALSGIGSAFAKTSGPAGPQGMSQGTYRVNNHGQITKIQQKRRKKGLRLPRYVQEQLKANAELTRTVSQVMLLNSIHGGKT